MSVPERGRFESSRGVSTELTDVLGQVVAALCRPESYAAVWRERAFKSPMPSIQTLAEIMELLRAVLFPGYYGAHEVTPETMPYMVGSALDRVYRELREQIRRGRCFECVRHADGRDEGDAGQEAGQESGLTCEMCDAEAGDAASAFLRGLPELRRLLATDVAAAFAGDPAAKNPGETIFCYPSVRALTNYRVANLLHRLGARIIPRIVTEMAHSVTGIDIHPGATIGEGFFIDHGTGVVLGETCVIGKNVRLYQGVTLGAKSFPTDAAGNPIKGLPRHPIIEDDVIIYAGATILGRVTIGKGATIGGNVWLTQDVAPGVTVVQAESKPRFVNES